VLASINPTSFAIFTPMVNSLFIPIINKLFGKDRGLKLPGSEGG